MIHQEIVSGGALNRYRDAVPMTRTEDQSPQNEHVQGALEQLQG